LLPGVLLKNAGQRFICKNVHLRSEISNQIKSLKIPIAHGEGRFYAADSVLEQLEFNRQIIYRYCDTDGNINAQSNPNGTAYNIAGICNSERNVFGMMPHPERATSKALSNMDGKVIFSELFGLN
jgi:phosphoribosylformylglycinamidine synthase